MQGHFLLPNNEYELSIFGRSSEICGVIWLRPGGKSAVTCKSQLEDATSRNARTLEGVVSTRSALCLLAGKCKEVAFKR